MGVVVKRAPSDAAGIVRVRRELVVNACMAQRVLSEALDVVNRFRRIGVTDKLGVEISRVVRRLQGEAEVVHGENVFEKLRLLEIADAARLARGIELMRKRIRSGVKVMVVFGLIDAHSP